MECEIVWFVIKYWILANSTNYCVSWYQTVHSSWWHITDLFEQPITELDLLTPNTLMRKNDENCEFGHISLS